MSLRFVDSVGKAPCHQALQPEFSPRAPRGRRGEEIQANCPMTSPGMRCHVCIHISQTCQLNKQGKGRDGRRDGATEEGRNV